MKGEQKEMKNELTLTFAGQAGFIIQSKSGYRIGVDLYLSDCCERYFGFKRLMPYIFNPQELKLDLLIATHAHYDHFDPDSVPLIMSDKKTQLLCAYDVKTEAERLNLEKERITYIKDGDIFKNDCVTVKAMPCDHGEETPDAIGLLITVDNKRIYIAGDTAYREDYFLNDELKELDVMIMPINGAFGNLNEKEATKAIEIISPKLCIPCHYWNFAEHGGNPHIFKTEMDEKHKDVEYILMRPGETISL